MAVDWIALNALYSGQGYGTSHAFTGNTIWGYGTNITTSQSTAYANLATYAATNAFTIVDGGGTDTVDFSNYNANQTIDLYISTTSLTHAWLSSVGGLTKNMTIAVGSIIENATTGGGNDVLYGNTVSNVLTGNGGNDSMYGYGANDTFYGGSGNDYLSASGVGNNYLDGGSGNDSLYGASGNDTAYGGDNSDYVSLYSGNDYATGNAGTDTLYGGDGNDTMWAYDSSGNSENDQVYGGNGSDYIYMAYGAETLDGGTDTIGGQDTLYSFNVNDVSLNMDTGVTNITGASAVNFEVVYMYTGNDTVYASANATVYGGNGDDLLIGNDTAGGAEQLYGDAGNDTTSGGFYVDTVYGGAGNDVFKMEGGGWVDHVYGGADIDTLDLSNYNAAFSFDVNLATGSYIYHNNPGFGTWTVNGVENVIGSSGDDSITGDGLGNYIDGGAGNDTINDGSDPFPGGDTVFGGSGDDLINAGDTEFEGDSWDGGSGTDTLSFAGTTNWGEGTGVTFNFVTGQATYAIYTETFANFEIFQDNNGGDRIIADGNGHQFYGNGGNDTMVASAGLEYMYGGAGTNTVDLTANSGPVQFDMSTGATQTSGELYQGFQVAMMGAGSDSVDGSASADTIYGGDGNDTLNGHSGVDSLVGGEGNDLLVYSSGEYYDNMDGGNGNDTAMFDWASPMTFDLLAGTYGDTFGYPGTTWALTNIENIIKTGLSNDTLIGNTVGNMLDAGDGDDSLAGGLGNDSLYGGAGNDTLNSGSGNDSLVGGAGNDWYYVDVQADIVVEIAGNGTADRVLATNNYVLAAGADIELLTTASSAGTTAVNLTGNELAQQIWGNNGVNVLMGMGGNDTIFGGDGDDTLNGGAGMDSLSGGVGNDWYYVDVSGDVVTETAGNGTADRVLASDSYALASTADIEILTTTLAAGTVSINLTGNDLAQSITGNNGVNVLNGLGGNDTIFGGDGNDTLNGGTGVDSLVGGAGDDWYYVDDAGDKVVEATGNGTADRVLATVNYTLGVGVDVELISTTLAAGTTAINLTGNDLAQSITGNAGVNVLSGLGGNDTLYGGAGTDTLNGGTGVDSLVGGADSDWYYVDDAGDKVVETAGNGTADRVLSTVSYILAAAADIEQLSTTLASGTTAINLTGNGLSQSVTGNEGVNILSGLGGNDSIYGGGGNDTLYGGDGNDVLNGGNGQDTFVFNTALNAASNVDTIQNFVVADDVINLAASIFTGLAAGAQVGAFVSNTTGTAALSTDHIIYQSNTGNIYFDVDGVGGVAAVLFAKVGANLAGFDGNDFFVF